MLFHAKFQMTFGEQNTEKEAHEMLSYAVEHGINTLDTAEMVRNNDSVVTLHVFSPQVLISLLD